ncbi:MULTISPECIES: amino acid permease [unclassified Pseudomonas]|jgi:D-serine/D-alanine/glycine transporter|uniref:amino acid permease n=1 Tax=unclassified Pseudomonas TaxID=196821 RepID=UPI001780C9FB|nr:MULTISPECIES: amino acid permease [unclassified Pseudomonas]MBD9655306.1 amino acid permease [Pseudomonas sp. PDM12]CAH0294496.1 D-serine/D-alanine/glycine transporter [Pseudomonas sp. Bi70]
MEKISVLQDEVLPPSEPHLKRALKNRHIQFISIGGAIGTGLFMGSGKAIALSGTSIILVYMIVGFFLFFIMRAMGELLLTDLRFRSFADVVAHYLGLRAGYMLSWSYWLSWSVAIIADVIVVAGFFQFWFPDVPIWATASFTMLLLLALNMMAVKLFGEVEFWFAIIKIVAIVALIVTAFILIGISYQSPEGVTASLNNLFEKGTMLPHGISGFLAGFQIAIFSFAGTELIGTTAAEAENPKRNLPKAINTIPFRILIFYVLALACIISVTSWSHVPADRSPFVELFLFAGFPAAAGIINFVVLTSAASSANSGVYASCRMLFGLARRNSAPSFFAKLSRSGVPVMAIAFSGIAMFCGLCLLTIFPNVMELFTVVSTVATILNLYIWTMIMLGYLAYRKKAPELHQSSIFKLPGGRITSVACLGFLLAGFWVLSLQADTRLALYVMPFWFLFLFVSYRPRKAASDQVGSQITQ